MRPKRRLLLLCLACVSGVAGAAAPNPIFASAGARAQQSEETRKPKTPIQSPVIKLPRGQFGATEEATAEAEAVSKPAARTRWEYCAITHTTTKRSDYSSRSTGVAVIRYYPGGTEEVEGAYEGDAFDKAMAKLGEDGWELVAIRERIGLSDGTGTSAGSYYFKRPK
jgi:hypothetical protein